MTADRILIVDDNPANLKVARFALESDGYEVLTAADGEEALALLREIRPTLILMDIQLPGMDGLELTRQLKADPATRGIVIVAVTAYAMKGDREKALRAGCDGYLSKPIDPILLPTQVADHLKRVGHDPLVDDVGAVPAPAPLRSLTTRPNVEGPSRPIDASDAAKQTILVIEDNPATRRMYRLTLETAGYEVIEARDGATALDLLQHRRPALIVQDLILPDIDGLELVRRIREQMGDSPPILCVSGFLSRLGEARAAKAGFAQLLLKPVDPFHLLDTVKIHLTSPPGVVEAIGAGRLLIVVEDDPLERKLAQIWLSSAGFNVLVAGDGEEGLALARQERPAAIVSDVLMPKMDGFTLCLTVRRDPDLGGVPVILTSSAYTEQADLELARRVGASALLPKAGGLELVARALTAALDSPMLPAPIEPVQVIERDHDRRARLQLDRQVLENSSLLRRSTLQQAQLAVLAGVADALSRNVLVAGVLGDVLASCLDMAGVSKGALYLMNSEDRLELKHQIGFSESESVRLRAKFGHAELFADIANRGRVVSVPSEALSPDMAQRLIIDAGVTSLLIVPVSAGVRTYGTLLLGARNTDVADEDALAFARVLGAQMGQAVGLAEAFGRLEASELRYRTLTENANDAICILTRDGVVQEVNHRFTEIFGYPAEHFIGRPIRECAAPIPVSEPAERVRTIVATDSRSPQLYEIQKPDGQVGFVEFSTATVDIEGEALVLAIGRDVTERRQQARLLALTAAVGLALNNADSLTGALQDCAQALVRHLGAALGRIWTINEREDVLELRASAGLGMPIDDPARRVPLGEHKIGRIAQNRRPYLTNAVIDDPQVSDQAWAQREGIVAFAGHPLMVGERVVGVMALFAKHALSDEVISALASVAAHVALGVERHGSAEALRTAEERMRFALQSANVGIWDMDYTTGALRLSVTAEAHYGLAPGTFAGTFEAFVECIHPDDRQSVLDTLGKAMASGADFSLLNRSRWPDGSVRWLNGAGRVHLGAHGEPVRAVGISLDVTERRTLEEQFQLAQKMEAVGQLAGGVAHDFNNLLTAILGFSNLVMDSLEVNDARRSDLQEVTKAGERAQALTKQLLAFSRKQVLRPVAVDVNVLVAGVRKMLARVIGEQVDLVTNLAPNLRIVRADPGQLEQIVTNLVVNARDAMPSGGRVSIETANVELDVSYTMQHQAVIPGSYVLLAVSDDGTGMNEETKRRLFEPFFTTKEAGKGTGLGLATVYGIVKQSRGYIWVYSEPGAGTTFKIYLPVDDEVEQDRQSAERPEDVAVGGTETVLVVEDEEAVRFLTRVILEKAGYRIVEAPNPREAEALFAKNPEGIDLLVTDVIMPGSTGPQLFERLAKVRSDLRVLYVSGYTDDEIVHRGQLDPGVEFLQKPFTAADLNRRVREVIDR